MTALRTGRNKLFCVIISIFLVLSGTVFTDTETDPSFCSAFASDRETGSSIKSARSVITDIQACTEEVSGLRGSIFVRQSARHDGHERKTGTSGAFTAACNTSVHRHTHHYIRLGTDGYGNTCPEAVITDYIHKSDGKKRI